MARVTVEDCVENIHNRFKLVLVASNRSKQLSRGSVPIVERSNNKNPVLALREIAISKERAEELEESLIMSLQKFQVINDFDAAEQDCEGDQDWSEQIALLSKELESLTEGDDLLDLDVEEGLAEEEASEDSEETSEEDISDEEE
jgi:DNA-directed RNA polymerase subunit omega